MVRTLPWFCHTSFLLHVDQPHLGTIWSQITPICNFSDLRGIRDRSEMMAFATESRLHEGMQPIPRLMNFQVPRRHEDAGSVIVMIVCLKGPAVYDPKVPYKSGSWMLCVCWDRDLHFTKTLNWIEVMAETWTALLFEDEVHLIEQWHQVENTPWEKGILSASKSTENFAGPNFVWTMYNKFTFYLALYTNSCSGNWPGRPCFSYWLTLLNSYFKIWVFCGVLFNLSWFRPLIWKLVRLSILHVHGMLQKIGT